MANPARSFLLCSCTPLSEILSTPREEKPVSLTPPPQTISCGGTEEQTSTTTLALGFLRQLSTIPHHLLLPLLPILTRSDAAPDSSSSLTSCYHQHIQPHSLAGPLCFFVACSAGVIGFASLQAASEPVQYHSAALCHLPLNPAPHLLILLLMMSICSLPVKRLLTCVIHGIDFIFFYCLFHCTLTEIHIRKSHSTPITY